MQAQIRNRYTHLGPYSGQNLPWRKMIPQVHPDRRKTRGEAPGLVRFEYQFLLLTHFTHKTRNWGTGVEPIMIPGRPYYCFHLGMNHPGMDHRSQVLRYEQSRGQYEPIRDGYWPKVYPELIPISWKSGNTIPQNYGVCIFPRTVTRDAIPHVSHDVAFKSI